jgi:hypothetical protein
MQVKYIAHDGAEFFDEVQCRAYEKLIEASNDSLFKKAVRSLFHGCISHGDDGYGSNTEEIFCLKHLDKFTANLVRALPTLQDELAKTVEKLVQARCEQEERRVK